MDNIQFVLDRLEAIDKKFDDKLDAILIQTTKTNGRVSSLEDWRKHIYKVVWGILGIVATIIGFYIKKQIKWQNKSHPSQYG